MYKVDLLIIDPQKDFCDQTGALFVKGADKDSLNLSKMIDRIGSKLNDIHVTLDTHHNLDIAHPIFWLGKQNQHPNPFTIITYDDVESGIWRTTIPSFQDRAKNYVKQLRDNKRYLLCIWPPHCLIGHPGANIQNDICMSLDNWEHKYKGFVDYVTKGSNLWTEHYSAVLADVPDPDDPSTQLNTKLIQTLQEVDMIAISGQALSHCVANTIRDIANNFGEENIKKFVLLEDTSSNVEGFENLGKDFVTEMVSRGMQISNSVDFLK
jgi:nicotinamidase-related amidase